MNYFDLETVRTWGLILLLIFVITKLSRLFLGNAESSVIQSINVMIDLEPKEILDACVALIDRDPKLKLHFLSNSEIVINKKLEFSRAAAQISVVIKTISKNKSEVTITSMPRFFMKGVVSIDFGQNLENVEYFSKYLESIESCKQ